MKVWDVIKRIEADGWVFVRYGGRSSHHIYKTGRRTRGNFHLRQRLKRSFVGYRLYQQLRAAKA